MTCATARSALVKHSVKFPLSPKIENVLGTPDVEVANSPSTGKKLNY